MCLLLVPVLLQNMPMSGNLGPKAASVAVYFEKYVLSVAYLFFAWVEFHTFLKLAGPHFLTLRLIWIAPPMTRNIVLAEGGRRIVECLLFFFTGTLLLLGLRPSVRPQQLKDIVVPLSVTFYFILYPAVRWFPLSLQKSLCPQSLQLPFILVGFLLCVIGPAFTVWAILYLRRSFGILVVVRKVVLAGPYRWVRHPMYMGYLAMLTGLLLANFSAAYFILVPVQILLLIYRARLEEARLCANSSEYREYTKRVGFLFPKFYRPATDCQEQNEPLTLRSEGK